jgi:hypothetical protein
MQCKFCGQDIEKPCRNASELSERASAGVGRCETAMKKQNTQDSPSMDNEKG